MLARGDKPAVLPLAVEKLPLQGTGPERPPPRVNQRLTQITQVTILLFALITFAYVARSVVLPVLVAWVVSMALRPPVRWLRGWGVPLPIGAAIVVTVVTAFGVVGIVHLGRPALAWLQAAPENVPQLKEKYRHVFRPVVQLSEAAASMNLDAADGSSHKPPPVAVKDNTTTTTVFNWTGSLLGGIGETVALVFLLLASGDVLIRKLVHVIPRIRDKRQALEISHEIQLHISKYLFSVGLVNVVFGIVVGLTLHVLGLPNAVMWGTVVALLNFIPYFGAVMGVILVTLAGLFAFDTLGKALLPAGAYLLLHLVEANAVTPFVLGKRFSLNPVIIFVALIFGIWLWGITGALLAVPLLVTLKVVSDRLPSLSVISEFLAGATTGPANKH